MIKTNYTLFIFFQTSLGWWEWIVFKGNEFGTTAINACDYLGDSLSSFFGITTPKYQFEIDHFNMMKQMVSSQGLFYFSSN